MKKSFLLLMIFFFLCITVFYVNPSFALIIDQDTSTGALQIKFFEPLGQSFTATDTDIGYVGVWIEPFNQIFNDFTLTMSIYSGEGDFSSGALLYTDSFTLAEGYYDWLDLDVSSVSFTQGEAYTIGIFNDTGQWGVSINWNGNPYSGGQSYYSGSLFNYVPEEGDLKFHVGPAPVPEPTTMLLLGSGVVGLAGFRRKFKK